MNVTRVDFEQMILAAHDRAFEEQRVLPIMWEVIQQLVEGPKAKKKVFAAAELGWKDAQTPSGAFPNEVQDFVGMWIDRTIAHLSEATSGEPQYTLEPDIGVQVFDGALQAGCTPMTLTQAFGPPPAQWPFINYCIEQSYTAHVVPEDPAWQSKKKRKTGGGDWGCGGMGMDHFGAFGGAMPKGDWGKGAGKFGGKAKGKGKGKPQLQVEDENYLM